MKNKSHRPMKRPLVPHARSLYRAQPENADHYSAYTPAPSRTRPAAVPPAAPPRSDADSRRRNPRIPAPPNSTLADHPESAGDPPPYLPADRLILTRSADPP